jgi:two-component system CheB/CheR fusion protein
MKKEITAKKNKNYSMPPAGNQDEVIVAGIGASAGGLDALGQFFENFTQTSAMAFVVVQHLDPLHKCVLAELLQHKTKMNVFEAVDRMPVRPNSVYVIPPNKNMSIFKGSLHLFDIVKKDGLSLPIDFFLRSLADERQEKSIGIILSGMGSDGSLGLKAIKEKGGITLVQQPSDAKFSAMPQNAIETAIIDIVAPADHLPEKLISYLSHTALMPVISGPDIKDQSALEKIIIIMRSYNGNDFSQYKKNTFYRRVERRMGIHKIDKIADYVRFLQENPAEIELLFKELLIGVTNFFRDASVWKELRDKIFPEMFSVFPNGYVIRAWISGCSTGEEAYSMAIVFKEALEKFKPKKFIMLQIFATDLDGDSIEKARKGLFKFNIASDVSAERLSAFFIKAEEGYLVNACIREMIVFAPQNVIKDPPFTKLDIISCRNLLIYIETELQQKMLNLFHYSLNPGGIMVLGSAETAGASTERFTAVNSKLRIYRRDKYCSNTELIDFPLSFSKKSPFNLAEKTVQAKTPENIQILADQLLLNNFSPASVMVNEKGDIVYITGHTGKYLEPPAGKTNWNIFAMMREGLRNEFPFAFRKVQQTGREVILRNVKINVNGEIQAVDVTINYIKKPDALKGMTIIIFNDVKSNDVKKRKKIKDADVNDTRLSNAGIELQNLYEELQNMREEMQTSEEELKSTNEELQSTNEELQSANEELTTSKEEMQSLNEELHTVNAELQSKVDDYSCINNDMRNLLNSTEIATLFLDKKLNISRFTTPATNIFNLIPGDVGRPITDLTTNLIYPGIFNDSNEVLRTLIFIEKTIAAANGKWFNVRIMPYRTLDDRIDGLVLTFIDITKLKKMELAFKNLNEMLRVLIGEAKISVIGIACDGKILEYNAGAEKLFGVKRINALGKNFIEYFIDAPLRNKAKADIQALLENCQPAEFETEVITVRRKKIPIKWPVSKVFDESGEVNGFMFIECREQK